MEVDQEQEEEEIILIQLPASTKYTDSESLQLGIQNMDSTNPQITIQDQKFNSEYAQLLGTPLLFQQKEEFQNAEFVAKIQRVLTISKME